MKYREMSRNYFFRELECQMTKEEVAELCFKSVRTVTGWDEGNPIPPECRRLMRMNKGRELSVSDDWQNFVMRHDRLELPNGKLVSAQQVLIGVAILELGGSNDIQVARQILKYARILKKMM